MNVWDSVFPGWPEPYIFGVYTVLLAGNHQIYGHIRCIYMVLAVTGCGWHGSSS